MPVQSDHTPQPLFSLDLGSFAEGSRLVDPLTQTLARPALIAQLVALKTDLDRTGEPFSVCLVNLDHLKSINDQWGHQTGDALLIAVVSRIMHLLEQPGQRTRRQLLGRFDGDGVMLASAPGELDSARILAEQIRAAVANLRMSGRLRVTASVGVTQYRIGEPLDATLARAEKALHLAKQFGRDRVEVAPTPVAQRRRPDLRSLTG